jgi:hypothetical protein
MSQPDYTGVQRLVHKHCTMFRTNGRSEDLSRLPHQEAFSRRAV